MALQHSTRRQAIGAMATFAALAACDSQGANHSAPTNEQQSFVKSFAVLVRRPGLSAQEFRLRLLGHVGQLARRIEGLGGLVLSESFGAGASEAPDSPYREAVDGFAQAWFADDPGDKAWLDNEIFDPARSRSFTVREEVVVPCPRVEGAVKRTLLLRRSAGLTHEEFLDHWLNRHAKLAKGVPGLTGAVFNPIPAEAGQDESPWREYDGITETWWETGPDDLGGKPSSPEADRWMADAANFLDLPRCRTISSIEHVLIEPK